MRGRGTLAIRLLHGVNIAMTFARFLFQNTNTKTLYKISFENAFLIALYYTDCILNIYFSHKKIREWKKQSQKFMAEFIATAVHRINNRFFFLSQNYSEIFVVNSMCRLWTVSLIHDKFFGNVSQTLVTQLVTLVSDDSQKI